MKKITKLFFRSNVIVLAISLIMISCGSGNSKKQTTTPEKQTEQKTVANSELSVKNVNKENWQAVIKATREGVDIPLPDGWSVEEAKPDRGSYIQVIFKMGGATNGAQFGQMLMDATKAVASNGNHRIEITEKEPKKVKRLRKLTRLTWS